DPSDSAAAEAVAAAKPDFIQLHGGETPARAAELRARFGIQIIKALGIADDGDFEQALCYEAAADMLLFDAKPPAGAGAPGGRARAFDWQLLRKRTIGKPWLLAGGLDAQNVARAIRCAGAWAVDVSSGVETAPGVKDGEAIRSFVAAARASASAPEPTA
ncbi:MAG TPA: phosphoribosylanthranilate isomerase, partial [Rhizomicrobium sp.]